MHRGAHNGIIGTGNANFNGDRGCLWGRPGDIRGRQGPGPDTTTYSRFRWREQRLMMSEFVRYEDATNVTETPIGS